MSGRNKNKDNPINSTKPIIGVTPLFDDERDSIWMLPGYMQGVQAAGGLPFILPFTNEPDDIAKLAGIIDGLLLTGGHDIDPELYGEQPHALCDKPNHVKDSLEYALLSEMLRLDKPLLGICRGIQLLNVFLGGTLYQDIPSQLGNAVSHDQKQPYDKPFHTINVVKDTPLCYMLGKTEAKVNSLHHQGVKRLADSLLPMALSADGLVEAAYMPDKRFVLAVQWHPEFSFRTDKDQMLLFVEFVEACKKYQA